MNETTETYHLTDEDAAIIKGLHVRGEKQQDIVAFFIMVRGSLNPARIANVISGKKEGIKFAHVEAASSKDLFPPLAVVLRQWRELLQLSVKIADTMKGTKS
jgi:hypothetical protein